MVLLLLTEKAKRRWIRSRIEKALAKLPTFWRLNEDGQAVLNRTALIEVDANLLEYTLGYESPFQTDISLTTEINRTARGIVLNEFTDDRTVVYQKNLDALCAQVGDALRSTDVSALAFQSHQLHRRALFEKLKSLTEAEFTEYAAEHLTKLLEMVSEATEHQAALASHELVPQNLRFAFCKDGRRFFVIQEPPRVRTIHIASRDGDATYSLALPYVTYVIAMSGSEYDHARVCFQTAPLKSLDDKICQPTLPNVMEELAICMKRDELAGLRTPYEVCEAVITNFWSSDFVTIDSGYSYVRHKYVRYTHDKWGDKAFSNDSVTVKSYEQWHAETLKHGVEFALTASWAALNNSVQDMIDLSIKRQDVTVDQEVTVAASIRQAAESLSRKLQTKLLAEAPVLPLDDLLKQKLRAHVVTITDDFIQKLMAQLKSYRVDKTAAPLAPKAIEGLTKKIMKENLALADTIAKLALLEKE